MNERRNFLLLLAIRINTFYGLIWWCRTNIISPSTGRIRVPSAKRPLLLHLRSIGKRRFSLRFFNFPGVAVEVRWDVTLRCRGIWCFFLLGHLWWMGCRDRCEGWNLLRTVAHQPLIGVSWIGIFVGWQYWSCWRNSIFRYHTSIWVL